MRLKTGLGICKLGTRNTNFQIGENTTHPKAGLDEDSDKYQGRFFFAHKYELSLDLHQMRFTCVWVHVSQKIFLLETDTP